MVNRRIYVVTVVNTILLAGLFEWLYPESDVGDVFLVILILGLLGAISINYILNKHLGSERNNDDTGKK